jgi:glycosyltransferase involved in cell wall biosynthesis
MRVLVWQWGRFGAMPRFAALLAAALRSLPKTEAFLSLSSDAELLRSKVPPHCDLPVETYGNHVGLVLRAVQAPFVSRTLARHLAVLKPELAVCIHPAPLDLLMTAALRDLRVPIVALVHDADRHPGDGSIFQTWLQRYVYRQANALGVLTAYVNDRLLMHGLANDPSRPIIRLNHPPVAYTMPPVGTDYHNTLRLLLFGRLLSYKGLDLLASSLKRIGPRPDLEVRVVGSGPDCAALQTLQALPGVEVENRWVPEDEVGALLSWSDALVLPYHEASQSGVAAAGLAAGKWILATRVGGLPEQLSGAPGAILCDPDAASLAAGLQRLLNAPRNARSSVSDPSAAWQSMAASLLGQVDALGLTIAYAADSLVPAT